MANTHTSGKKNTTVAGVVIALLIGGYTVLRPAINEATGWNLPSIAQEDNAVRKDDNVAKRVDDQPTRSSRASDAAESRDANLKDSSATVAAAQRSSTSNAKTETTQRGPLADRMSSSNAKSDSTSQNKPTSTDADESLKYGLLREVGRDRYISPAGLMYTPGSAEGHRLEHLRRHVSDQPGRPGKHGVFDGGMEGALKTIDKAYENAKAGKRTTKKTDKGRTIYTVDMGKRVGFVGGREGNRRRKPMARRVQLVLEGNRVITAYPL
ncbi:MAG: hypothetical protein ACF787_03480 [Rhodopirellula sp. JB053]|uniref:hypothetical protein n=1 Tax=Rhodopirellula sp. JB044 TaxID=3342844 RepID=UPI00370CBF2B